MLPKLDVPIYAMHLLSDPKKEINYRPFLVKEEKILLMASQSQESDDIKMAIKQILTNCVQEDINIDELATFDVEWILLNIRIQSLGSVLSTEYSCNNIVNDNVCSEPFRIEYNLNDIKPINKIKDSEIRLNDKIGVKMKFPVFGSMQDFENNEEFDFNLLKSTIDYVFDDNNVYPLKDQSNDEITAFFETFNKQQYLMIEEWLASLPRFIVEKDHVCNKCGFNHNVKIENLVDFF